MATKYKFYTRKPDGSIEHAATATVSENGNVTWEGNETAVIQNFLGDLRHSALGGKFDINKPAHWAVLPNILVGIMLSVTVE